MMPSQKDLLRATVLIVIAVLCIAGSRESAADAHAKAKDASDVNLLPPPQQVVAQSADLHRAHVPEVPYVNARHAYETGLHARQMVDDDPHPLAWR